MAELSDNVNWSEVDGNNNKAPPNGWPEGMYPSGVNDAARADRGAMKRFWNRLNPTTTITPTPILPSGNLWGLNLSNATLPAAYVEGEIFTFKAAAGSGPGDQFQVNSLGQKPIYRRVGSSAVPITTGDWLINARPQLVYDASLQAGAGGFLLLNPYVAPFHDDGSGNLTLFGTLTANGGATIGSAGINYSGIQIGHAFGFSWDGTAVHPWVDDVDQGEYASRNWVNTNYLSLAGGALSGALSVGSSGITYPGVGSGHYHAFSWDGTATHNWVDGFDQGELANRSWVSGNYLGLGGGTVSGAVVVHNITSTGADSNGYGMAINNANFFLTGNAAIGGGVYATGNLGGNVGVRASLCIQSDYNGTAFYAPNGNMVAVNFIPSDARLKTDIADSGVGLDAILSLAPKTYKRLARPEEEELGLVAQDVAAILPQAVSACELAPADANLGINYAVITTALIGAVKELTARLVALEAR